MRECWKSMTEEPPQQGRPQKDGWDPTEWHGHRIFTETDLVAAFPDEQPIERPVVYMRRLRHGVVLVVLLGLLVAAVLVALGIQRGDIRIGAFEPAPAPHASCPAGPFDFQDPSAVTVNVYNSTTIEGLASTVANQLRQRAFAVAEISNRSVNRQGMTAIIVSGPKGEANAFSVQRIIPEAVYLADDRPGRSVDVVIGSGFRALVPEEAVDITPGGLTCAGAAAQETVEEAEPESTPAQP